MGQDDKFKRLNEKLIEHHAATARTSDLMQNEGGYNPASPSAQLVNQKHADKAKTSSHAATALAHKPSSSGQMKPLGHLPSLKQLEAQAQAAALKPKK